MSGKANFVAQPVTRPSCNVALQISSATTALRRYKTNMATLDNILVVDDDSELRKLLREYLQKNGYRVRAVGDGNLGEDAKEPTLIKTIRGAGYVLAAEVEAAWQ